MADHAPDPATDPWRHPASGSRLQRPRLSVWERAALKAEDRRRMWENIAAAVFLAAFLALSFWVIDRISAYSRNVSCLQFKQRDCR